MKGAPNWTREKLAELSKSDLQLLIRNAIKREAQELVSLCEEEMKSRKSLKTTTSSSSNKNALSEYVAGYHFVCERDKGVRSDVEGTFWSGSWVVSKENAEKSLKFGAYVALHESKAQPSYRLGLMIGFQVSERDMVDKDNLGIEFHLREVQGSRDWQGGGSGEKGYLWAAVGASRED
jgi:hypothetical protein